MDKITTMAMWRKGADLPEAERSLDGLIQALHAGGFTIAIADVFQGKRPRGAFSDTPVDFDRVDDFAAAAQRLFAAGIRLWPMVNPFGVDPAEEAQLHASAATAVRDRVGEPVPLVVDYEFRYDGFFGVEFETNRDLFPKAETLPRTADYFANLRRHLGDLPLYVTPDPRQVGRDYPPDTLPRDAVLLLQTYHLDFRESWQATFTRYLPGVSGLDVSPDNVSPTAAAAGGYGGRRVVPMVEGNDSTLRLQEQLAFLTGKFTHVCVWGFGDLVASANPAHLDDFKVFRAVAGDFAFPHRP